MSGEGAEDQWERVDRDCNPHHRQSPTLHRLHHQSGGRGIVVERVNEKCFVGIVFLTLMRTNYAEWSLVMMINLQAAGLWDTIEYGTANYGEDWSAPATLLCMLPEEMLASLVCKETAVDAWEAIQTMRMGGVCIKEALVDKLHREFNHLQFKAGECVEDFVLHTTTITNQLRSVSDKITDKEVIKNPSLCP
jgi:hypothetical protein